MGSSKTAKPKANRFMSARKVIVEELLKTKEGLTASGIYAAVSSRWHVDQESLDVIVSSMKKQGYLKTHKVQCTQCYCSRFRYFPTHLGKLTYGKG